MKATKETHSPAPWNIKDKDSVIGDVCEVLEVVDGNGEAVIAIGTGGFACESDPHGAYPILEASDEDWALVIAAPGLLAACLAMRARVRDLGTPALLTQLDAAIAEATE